MTDDWLTAQITDSRATINLCEPELILIKQAMPICILDFLWPRQFYVFYSLFTFGEENIALDITCCPTTEYRTYSEQVIQFLGPHVEKNYLMSLDFMGMIWYWISNLFLKCPNEPFIVLQGEGNV